MDDAQNEIVGMWLHKADNDLQNIRNNLAAEEIPTDTICFHAQQAIEKVLKAVLVAHGQNASKTHDLVRLLTEVLEFIPELSQYEDSLEEITEYGVAVRYPNGFSEPSLDEAVKAYEIAKEIRTEILKKIDLN
ncbi:HEPN domain-containing protein [Geomonas paludis]|uniref:DNA-binding protein n=1 Tax=Geomonas paludis TaxID=2740185 RepID=A0A6V8MQQ1_9BACT|nr:HEPN domain-containing protein [Geomonas paludis]UPU36156.1 HEPN domain-containing protein [Geomonas paludis]GFO62234.1 DNA-binding protein [Geomonas paludis]